MHYAAPLRSAPMHLDDFRVMVDRLAREVPAEFHDGIVAIDVSPKTVPHPVHGDVYTLGECVPLEWSDSGVDLHSRIILYYGSFAGLARLGDFDWRDEAWETLTHELRHHLEWRANVDALAAYDWAAEQNFARHEGELFDPLFYRSGEELVPGVYKVDDDVFIEREQGAGSGEQGDLVWHGRRYRLAPPRTGAGLLFLTLDGLVEPPPGDAVLVVRPAPRLRDLFRRPPAPAHETVQATLVDA